MCRNDPISGLSSEVLSVLFRRTKLLAGEGGYPAVLHAGTHWKPLSPPCPSLHDQRIRLMSGTTRAHPGAWIFPRQRIRRCSLPTQLILEGPLPCAKPSSFLLPAPPSPSRTGASSTSPPVRPSPPSRFVRPWSALG